MICRFCSKEIPDGSSFCNWCGKLVGKLPRQQKPYHANGYGYVFKRDGAKTYTARVTDMAMSRMTPDGKFHRKFVQKGGFKTESEARLWCSDWYRHRIERPAAPALMKYWELYRTGEFTKLSKSKQTAYNKAWERLLPIASIGIDKLTVADLRKVVDEQSTSYYTGRDMKVLLNHLFDLGGADGYCQKDLPSYIILKEHEEKEATAFTTDEMIKMWKAYESGDKRAAWPLLMIYTGMMPGETMGLRVEMIDLEARTITGAGLKTSVRKKSYVYLSPTIIPVIEDLIGDRSEGKLFRRNKDKLYDDYHAFTRDTGVRDLEPYSCRHSTGTALAVDQNISPETIRKVMRWSKTSNMIARYAHPSDTDALKAVELLQKPESNVD